MQPYKPYSRNKAPKRLDSEFGFGNKNEVSQSIISREPRRTGRKPLNNDMQISQNFGKSKNINEFCYKNNLRGLEVQKYPENHFRSNEDFKRKPIELIISNLDSSIDSQELSNLLLNKLKQYVMVLSFAMNVQTDGSLMAIVKVYTQQEAQLVISHLHHQRLGNKRITVSYIQPKSDSEQLRCIVIALLQEVPSNQMPLVKFFGLVESRYHCNISLSEVNQLKDVCKITTGPGGRMISLTTKAVISLPLQLENSLLQHAYCTFHCPDGQKSRSWGDSLDLSLPNVRISLKLFENYVHKLLVSHSGCLPLLSFPICYAVEIGQPLPEDESGVPLEHLFTCIASVNLTCDNQNKNIKYLTMKNPEDIKKKEDIFNKSVSPSLMSNISMFCREMVDLLKTVENCQLLLLRFIPTYHHHFGRQCRVADYGFTRLVDLFEGISHVVQILGYGSKRIITLTHSAQIRRFTSDLLRLLKGQVSKRVALSNFSFAYEKTFQKVFNPIEYGLCSFEDLLSEIQEGTVVITSIDNVDTICIPKRREQTPEEEQKTKQFALEVQQLLSHSPHNCMLFNRFIPYYHHHFGRQCKLSDYGFSKLDELFEAISDTVDVEGHRDIDRKVKLKQHLALEVLGGQIQTIIMESRHPALYIEDVFAIFKQRYGFTLKPEMYNFKDHMELVLKLNDFVQVIHSGAGTLLAITDIDITTLEIRVWSLLLQPPHMSTITKFIYDYRIRFLGTLPITKLEQLKSVIMMSNNGTETIVSLTSYYILAARLYHLLFINEGCICLNDVALIYFRKFSNYLSPSDYGFRNLEDLLRQMSFVVTLIGGDSKQVILNQALSKYAIELPSVFSKQGYSTCEESCIWRPPTTNFIYNNFCCFTSPEPDATMHNGWSKFFGNNESSINSLQDITDNQILHDSISNILSATVPNISSPHPTNLPTPDRLIFQDDSGVNSFRDYTISHNECLPDEQIIR